MSNTMFEKTLEMTDEQKQGKVFENIFSSAFREETRCYLERIPDINRNAQPCDFFGVLPPTPNYPPLHLFLELKWTKHKDFPLANIQQHQLTAMRLYDGAIPSCHAGFILCLGAPERQIWYISGPHLWRYIQENPTAASLSHAYLLTHGIPIHYTFSRKTGKLRIFIVDFLSALSRSRPLAA